MSRIFEQKNKDLTSELSSVLIMANNLSREAVIRFQAGVSETATIGPVRSLQDIYARALLTALDYKEIDAGPLLTAQGRPEALESLRQAWESTDKIQRREAVSTLRDLLTPAVQPTEIRQPELEYAI
jgi:hypothetical protein